MVKKIITLVLVLLMVSPVFLTPQTTRNSTLSGATEPSQLASTDLDRVTWEADIAPNGDLESWTNPQSPEDMYASRTTEEVTWFETTIVNEGTRAVGMHARALDPSHGSEVRLTQQSWIYWDNPLNTTLDFDWYLDEIGNPINQDYFRIQVRMSGRTMFYYLGCTTSSTNITSTAYYLIDGPTKTWNHFHRNLTSDFFEVFSLMPAQFELVYIWIHSFTNEYTRIYLDDVQLVNGTYVHVGGSTLNGNFEGSGGWTFQSNRNPADISQSSVSNSGSWSMNMTAISYGYFAQASAQIYPGKRLSEINQGEFGFYWRVSEWINSSLNTLAYVRVSVANATASSNMYYYLGVGGAGTTPPVIFGNDMKFQVSGFNVTDSWLHFDRNLWEDYHLNSNTDFLYLDSIAFYVVANNAPSRLSVLIDDISLTTSILNDMSYETQGAVGTPIEGWTEPTGYDTYTVTDFSMTGTKAGNLTLQENQEFNAQQYAGNLQFDETTEIIFDFNLYMDTFNQSSADDFFVYDFEFEDGESLTYVLANASSDFEGWISESSNVIFLNDEVSTGQWMNFQLDLVHDYETVVGSLPDTKLMRFHMISWASASSRLVAFLDDMYIYYDPAPDITDIDRTAGAIAPGGDIIISATVIDATLDSVVLNYRVDGGSWLQQDMELVVSNTYEGNLSDVIEGAEYEYYITATDAFGKTTDGLDGTEYFSFIVGVTAPPPGLPLIPIIAVGVIAVVGVVIVWYFVIYKKK
ncbi:MAG: hypothetical protein ACFFEW_03725 [Candidatus Thorarchaeota archaeon]